MRRLQPVPGRGWAPPRPAILPRRILAAAGHRTLAGVRLVALRFSPRLLFLLGVAFAVLVVDQAARPIAQANLPPGVHIPIVGDRIILERADDLGSAAVAAALRARAIGGLVTLMITTLLTVYMGGYGITLLGALGLILGGSASNQLSWIAHGFVLNWIAYRVDQPVSGPFTVVTPADFAQMLGLAMIFSALTLFTVVSILDIRAASRSPRAGLNAA